MQTVIRTWRGQSRSQIYRIVPLFDIHLGHRACDEKLLKATVRRIADDPDCYWIGGGDYGEYINRSDKRYDEAMIAPWLLGARDLAGEQRDRLLDTVKPIASKCLGLMIGNHEETILRKYERDIYGELVTNIKAWAGMEPADKLGLGWYGWILLKHLRVTESDGKRAHTSLIRIVAHHGFSTGRLAGANALNMERWAWQHDCDLAVMGHSHRRLMLDAALKKVTSAGKPVMQVQKGAFCGTMLGRYVDDDEGAAPYYERAGYFGKAPGGVEIILRPGAVQQEDKVKIVL